ncbi:hypothetical protein SMD44_p10057 (plasmid) [Streptomyces alboflavus]|uniref:Uncharacterized protein n=1 Tax=Streptomyces alboflavus TaxID=67267 RepID=A0A291W4H5_9ACTN|nr:hypothetical protein [Streptomyces alboflavus]ATM24556.1 hypothetical protein SMD44_p10057 [Streptomyces alboflavus]
MSPADVKAACYGRGAIFPVAILDPRDRWACPTYPGLPEWQPEDGHGMLVLRWTAPPSQAAEGPRQLAAAAAQAPRAPSGPELAAYQASLPTGVHLISLPANHVIGPWAQRPGISHRT